LKQQNNASGGKMPNTWRKHKPSWKPICIRKGAIMADNEARMAQYIYQKGHGLTDLAIAAKLRISPSALWHWKNRHLPKPAKLVPTAVGNRVRMMPVGHRLDYVPPPKAGFVS
jgi:hypothetical protein